MTKENQKRDRDAAEDKVTNVGQPEAKRKRVEEETDKPQATDEKGEELLTSEGAKPTFICAIYRRDILSFLPRRKIEEMRTLSKRWNYDILKTSPDYLPRIVFHSLEVLIGPGQEYPGRNYRLTKGGFVNAAIHRHFNGRSILTFDRFSRCCKEVKEKAGQDLNGQLVFPHRDAGDVVTVRLDTNGRDRSCPVFRAPNKLTEETGGTLIHFLSHLDKACVYRLQVQADLPELSDERGEPIGALNPLIFNACRAAFKKPLRLYAKWVETQVVPINETSLRTARQLMTKFRGVCYSSHARQVDDMLALLTTARPDCSMICFNEFFARPVDRFVEYYRDYSGDIDSLIPEVHFPNLRWSYGTHWSTTCPKQDAQALMVGEWSRDKLTRFGETEQAARDYTYSFENATSGRRFKVILGADCTRSITWGDGEQVIRGQERIDLSRMTLRVL